MALLYAAIFDTELFASAQRLILRAMIRRRARVYARFIDMSYMPYADDMLPLMPR